ncbi:MAG: hypothetical protein P4L46_13345 [Fimbriimonas sp.]|nr:hypothetical protein [Fimbriimonas sp.]
MSFSVQLTPDFIPVEPGATTPVSVGVVNKSDELDRFELEIEGVDPEWTAVPVPSFAVDGLEARTEKIFFKPSRSSESLAGNYPFVVRVRSLISGESKTVQAILQVKPFNHISMEINPKKGHYSVWRKRNGFSLAIMNLGNTDHALQLTGADPEDSCAFEFESVQATVGPGAQREIYFEATPTSSSLFSAGRLIGFSVTGRSIDHPSVAATAQGQLEQRPVVTATGIIATVVIAVVIGLWLLMMPKPLQIISFSVNPQLVQRGQQVTISWVTSQADIVKVLAGNDVIAEGPQKSSSVTYTLNSAGDINFRIVASREGQEKREDIHLNVKEPPTSPDPEIISLTAKPTRVKLGASFELDYQLSDAVGKAVLEPTTEVLDTALSRREITPVHSGDIQYTVVATNKDGTKSVSKSITVTVYEESDATIIAFTPSNVNVPQSVGRVTLSWQVNNAARVELTSGNGSTEIVEPSGSQDLPLTAKTTYTLTAYDQKGRKTSLSRTVNVIQDIPQTPPVDGGIPPVQPGAGGTTPPTIAGGNGR